MEINWKIIAVVAFVIILLVAFLIRRNEKDKRELTEKLNNDYKTANEEEAELNDNR